MPADKHEHLTRAQLKVLADEQTEAFNRLAQVTNRTLKTLRETEDVLKKYGGHMPNCPAAKASNTICRCGWWAYRDMMR